MKVVLVGAARAGKTAILTRFMSDQFTLNSVTTIQAAFFQKKIQIKQNVTVTLDVWDTAGQERFHSLTPMYYRDADIVLVVFDLTEANSFARAKRWVTELQEALEDPVIVLVANKCDMQAMRVVPASEISAYAKNANVPFFETSAKTGYQIGEVFEIAVTQAYERHREPKSQSLPTRAEPTASKRCC